MLSCLPTTVYCTSKGTSLLLKEYESHKFCKRIFLGGSPRRNRLLKQTCCLEAIEDTKVITQLPHSQSAKSPSPPLSSSSSNSGDTRHSANFKATIYDYRYMQSLQSDYLEEAYSKRRDELKGEVKMMLTNKVVQDQDQLIMVVPRWEAHWFISVYPRLHDMNPNLLEFATLDFNIVQAIHQQEIKEISRDRVLESYNLAAGMRMEPMHRNFRMMATKMVLLATVVDDIYDVYGTYDELELFTQAVESWRIESMDMLPDYMKLAFLAVYNSVHEATYHTLKENGFYVLKYLKKPWIGLCKTYLQEAKWCQSGYTPTLEEYLDNSCVSIGIPMLLYLSYFTMANPINEKSFSCLEEFPSVVLNSSSIYRLADDIGSYWV